MATILGASRRRFFFLRSSLAAVTEVPGLVGIYREVVVWKMLQHPNIVPFLGVPAKTPPFEIICDWMENDRITEYAKKNQNVDRIGLVNRSVSPFTVSPRHLNAGFCRCGMWRMASTTSTHAT